MLIANIYIMAVLISEVYTDENNLEELCIKTVNGFKMSSSEELTFRNLVCDMVNKKESRKV
jgi:hypothetical protein